MLDEAQCGDRDDDEDSVLHFFGSFSLGQVEKAARGAEELDLPDDLVSALLTMEHYKKKGEIPMNDEFLEM